jgi:hypothetical protein
MPASEGGGASEPWATLDDVLDEPGGGAVVVVVVVGGGFGPIGISCASA